MHFLWNRHKHSNRAMGTPVSNSSRQIVHSASSTQSFSVAAYVYIPVRRGTTGTGVPSTTGLGLPYWLWVRMQLLICASRRTSKSGSDWDGNSRWHTGHSSSSAICGVGGNARCCLDDDASPKMLCLLRYAADCAATAAIKRSRDVWYDRLVRLAFGGSVDVLWPWRFCLILC